MVGFASCKPADALVFTPPYGSMEGVLSLLGVIHFVCLFFCTVTDFSAAEKATGMKFCMLDLLSGPVFSPLVNIGSRGVTGAAA